jgi:Spy/CpxP family protein refolding chaperone
MTHRIPATTILGLMMLPMLLAAQPPGIGEFHGPEGARVPGSDRRLEVAADYLELTDGQLVEWEGLLDSHRQTAQQEWQEIASLREQFRYLAETEDPDLAELGGLALTIHQRSEAMRSLRTELNDQLASILTPDQLEKFEALRTARETFRPRGKRNRPHRGARPDSSSGTD